MASRPLVRISGVQVEKHRSSLICGILLWWNFHKEQVEKCHGCGLTYRMNLFLPATRAMNFCHVLRQGSSQYDPSWLSQLPFQPLADHTCVCCPPRLQPTSRPHNRHARGFCLLTLLFPSPSCAFLQCPPSKSSSLIPFCPQSLSWLQLCSPSPCGRLTSPWRQLTSCCSSTYRAF